MTALLSVADVHWRPPGAFGDILAGTSFELHPRRLTVLIGPSGCGKSSLGYLIAGYERPSSGWIRFEGRPVTAPGPDRLMVFQESALWPWMTVLDNVAFGPLARGEMEEAEAHARAQALLDEFGLGAFARKYPGQLSGGMKRRVDFAQALINQPHLLILDEPFRGLDVMTRELMQEYFLAHVEGRGQTTLFISSEVEEAVFLADEVLVMGPGGRIVERLTIDLPRPRTPDVADSAAFQRLQTALLDSLEAVQKPTAA